MKNIKVLITAIIFTLCLGNTAHSSDIEEGKKLAFDRKKGNCLACHMMDDGELAGNNGPPLIAMKARFPNKQDLFDQIWDPTENDPNSFMPPFGKHGAISKTEINKIIEYLYTLWGTLWTEEIF